MKRTFAIAPAALTLLFSAAICGAVDRGSVSGLILDGQGKPIAGARIWIKPSVTTGLVQVHSGEDGRFRAEGLLNIPYNAYAWYNMSYHDKTLCMRVAPESITGYDSFVATDGAVRNFKLRISGTIEDRDNIYYGGEVRVFYTGIARDAVVQVKFEPQGPLADGSTGKTIVKSPKDMLIEDVPVGVYRVTAEITDAHGKRSAHLSLRNFDAAPAQAVTLEWESKDSCVGSFGNGLDRAFLYIQ